MRWQVTSSMTANSEPAKYLCDGCGVIYRTESKLRECIEEHEKKARRDRARAFAKGGPSRFKKPEAAR